MKKPTTLKLVLAVLLCIQSFVIYSQKNFTPRFDTSLKGDMLLIGNNILNRDNNKNGERPNDAFNATNQNNNDLTMGYIDVDNDASTFSSSSATLAVPSSSRECYKIVYAGLYWSGIYSKASVDDKTVTRSNLGSIKVKLPSQTAYTDITGQLIYDYYPSTSNGSQMPYAYYYDLTSLVQGLANPEGEYTVANIISARGKINGGFSAGWNLFVVYEDPKSSAKYITTFDGLRWIEANSTAVTYTISGFKTIPTGTVKAKLAFAALEGDVNLTGDKYSINNTDISTTERLVNNFFNSTINDTNGPFTNRNPASGNTLGFEAGILNVPNPATTANPGGSVIKNNDTSATLKLTTSGDGYGLFFNAFNVEIIEPKIVLTKIVKDALGNNIGGQNVTLGQQLNYEIGFKNTGNDNATSFTIRDELPINIIFNYPADIVSLPSGVTVQSYNATTRNIVFKVDNSVVKVGDPEKVISFKVQVVPDCKSLSEACSNSIDNSAYATYKGTQNTAFTISDDPSVNTNTGCILVPKATNFLVGVDGCKYTDNVTLCGDSINLTAASGYSDYTWFSDEAQTQQIGKGQTLNVKDPGTYYVYNLAAAPCRSIYQSFVVTRFGTTVENPIIPFADQVVTCSNDGKKLPNIFLCGGNASKQITLSISDATSIVWEKLTEGGACLPVTNQNCANDSDACKNNWSSVGSGSNYSANQAGQFRVTLNYAGGCFTRFYFNVYSNSLTPTETHKDIICGAPGSITIGGVPAGYEYAISTDPNGTLSAYQTSNVFPITSPNSYTVHIRQVGVTTNPCIFTVPSILIRTRELNISTSVTQPTCSTDKGSIKVGAENIEPQYYYYIYNSGGTLVNSFGPSQNSDYTFANLSSGVYSVRVTNGPVGSTPAPACDKTVQVTVNPVPAGLNVTAALTVPLTACSNGKIVVTPTGGTAPYYYFINGSTSFQTTNEIDVTAAGKYDIRVVDANNCSGTTSITVTANPKPTYTVTASEIYCSGGTSQITVNVTNANGYTLEYSKDNGVTFSSNPVFSNVAAGTYNVVVRYTMAGTTCTDPATSITIAAPANSLSASAGVAELAGCDPSGNGYGKVRITNPQGGTAPYTYSFDGGNTYITSNEAYVAPGTYTLYIKDAKGCIYSMPGVILDPRPADPTISVGAPVYNCNGTATSTVTVTSGGGTNYSYEYYLDNVLNTNTPSNVFVNVPSGSHTVSVKYNLVSVPTYSNLLLEDFGSGGTTTTPGIAAAYCFNDQRVNPPYTCSLNGTPTRSVEDNQYSVTSFFWRNDNAWYHFTDHTTNGADPNGRYLLVNIGAAAGNYGVLYSKPIVDVIPNQPVMVDLYVANLLNAGVTGAAPIVRFELVNSAGQVVATQDTGKIAEAANDPNRTKWVPINISLNPGNNTNLTFRIRSGSIEYGGNDIVIDDIWVRQIPKSCISQKDFPIVIDSNKAFSASITGFKNLTCAGSNNGEITIAAQNFNLPYGFDYSLDNGATWVNSKVSPVTATGLTNKTYSIRVRFDSSASSCTFPFSQVITAPAALAVTARVTAQPTCSNGASITATVTGGTPSYQYELRGSNGTTVVVPFQTSNVFTNVATGTYTVVVKDTNACTSPASATVNISSPTVPTATLAASSDLCYDSTNQSTLVVTATGTGTLTYSLDGGAAQTSNTFTNVGPGTHNVLVTDSNNCTATISNIVIAPELQATAAVTKVIDCTSSPNAQITVTITGGTSAFTYKVKRNGNYGSSNNVTGNSFVYTANNTGTYTFEITDAKGCVTTTSATINARTNPTVTATKVDATCNGTSTGSVELTAAGGSGTYTYLFYNSTTTPVPTTYTTQTSYTGLAAGTYNYRVMDSGTCTSAVGSITINQPTTLTATASATAFSCNTSNVKQSATVTIAVPTTGTSPYQYSFDGGTTFTSTRTLTVTDNGTNQTISYVVSDAQGCKTPVQTITINRLNPPTDITFSANAVTCTATTTTVTATATNGVGTLTYAITSPTASIASNTTGVFSGLAAGTYNFRVTDANGCYFEKPYTINAVTPIAVVGNKTSDALCKGGATGSGTYTVSGNATAGAYTFTLTAGTLGSGTLTKSGNTLTLSNVVAGTYTVRITDSATGCTATASIVIGEPANAVTFTAVASNVNCNNDNSQITVTATGGTPNYTYAAVKSGATAPTVYDASNVVTVDTNSGADLVWDVYVKDTNGCIAKNAVTVAKDNLPTVTATNGNQCTASGNSFTITATGTGLAPLMYSIDGTSFQTSNVFNVPAGTYTVTVRDKNNCTATTATALTIYPQLTTVGSVTKELDCTTTPNATITVTITGGRSPYTYTTKKGSGTASAPSASITGPTFTYSVTPANADTYTFVVTDANGCQSTAVTKVDPITNPTVTAVQTNASCNGASDGSVTLTGAGGSGGFTYSNNATTGFTASPTFAGLAAGNYTFYVKDSKGCTGSVAVTITQPATLAATIATVPFSCNTSNGKVAGTVTINVTAGTGTAPYQYSFNGSGYSSNNVLTLNDNGTDQAFTYAVRDAKGCPVTGSGTLLRLNPPTDLTFAAPAVTCTATTTTVTLTAVNGVGALQYETIAPSTVIIAKQTSNSFANLAPGSYTFRVTDANGCYYTEPYVVSPVTPITVVGNKTSDVLCKGGATGSGTYTVSGNATVGVYTFTLTAGTLGSGTLTKSGNTLTLSNVAVGTYTVQVTDTATGCTNTASITIDEPAVALSATAVSTNVNCNNDNAQITVTASGGTPNYTYAYAQSPSTVPTSAYVNSNVLTVDTNSGANLGWDVYVKDANGCTTKTPVTVVVDALPAITNVTVNNQCAGSGSTFTITATATGLAPLSYGINGPTGAFQSTGTFTVAAGTYTVYVKDKNNCVVAATTTTTVYPQLTAAGAVTKELDCTATPNATITVTIGGGRSQYTYTVQKGSGTPSAPSASITGPTFTYSVTPANADTYTFVITDANGCQKTAVVTVDPITNPTVTAVQTNASCNGASDGSVTLTGAGGSGGFSYSNNATTGFTASPTFAGLAAGSYTFYVKDSKGCTGSVAVTITQPATLAATIATVPFSCNTSNGKVAGTVTINVTVGTGTAPYQYSFNGSGYSSNNVLTLNDNGTDQAFTYAVRDAKGCPVTGSGTLLRLNPPTDLTFAAPAVTCTATTTTVTLTAVNGVGALQYETIAPSPVIIAKQTSNAFANLAPGTYMFKVTDANGCYYTESYTVKPVTPITLTANKLSDVLCNGGNTGSIRLNVAGFGSTYSYTVNGGTAVTGVNTATVTLPNLTAGTYAIVVTDEVTGCTAPASITINEPAAALAATYATVNANCFVGTSEVTVTATGGTPVYRYSFVQDGAAVGTYSNNNKANLDPAVNLNWDVYIIDANNCTFKLDVTIARDAVPTVTASATGQCFGVGSYTITATPGAGLVAPLSYSINNGASYQAGNTFVITTPGNYTVKIKDGNGCTANSNVVIVDTKLTLSAVLNKDITCSAPTAAQVTLTAGGGNGTYTYTSSPNTGTFAGNVFTTNTAGTYTFTVTDGNGCPATASVVITAPVFPDITGVTQTQVISCNGDNSGAISITIDNSKGQAPFVYNVLNTTTGVDYGQQTSGLAAGDYVITVTDAKGCTDTFPITITQPDPIVIDYSTTPLRCNGSGITQGTITINSVVGGTPLYDYYVTGINNYNKSITGQSGGSAVFEVVDFGLYQIRVVDQNGCTAQISNVLIAAPVNELDIQVDVTANCAGGQATVRILSAFAGNGPFHFNIYNGPGQVWTADGVGGWQGEIPANSKTTTFTGLTPGKTYSFIVYDEDTRCYYFQSSNGPIPTSSTLVLDTFVPRNITCTGANDGNVSFTVRNNYATPVDISYDIINAFTNVSTGNTGTRTIAAGASAVINLAAATPLPVGSYYVLVSETSGSNVGCGISSANFNIEESPVELSVTASVSKTANCNANSGIITAVAKDGTGPYTYLLLLDTDPTPTATTAGWASANTFNRNAGNYIAYAKDAYGCIKSAAVTLDKYTDPTITAPAEICYDGNPFIITVGGNVDPAIAGAATYSVNGSTFQTSPDFTYNAPGTYTLVIKDGNGCTATTTYEVKPQLQLSVELTKELDCTVSPAAQITLTATGGYNTNYTYEYSTNGGGSYITMTSNVLTTSVLGNYIFRVSDDKLPTACQATATFTLDPLPNTVFTTAQTDVSCNGGTDGTITVNVTSGVGPYQYQLDSGSFQTSNVFTGLSAGTSYIITVRDAKSCVFPSAAITINEPADLSASSTITTALVCNTGNVPSKAVVTVTGIDGTSPYLYSFDNGTTYTSENTFETYVGTTFDVLVKDAKGCIYTLVNGVNVPALNPPTITTITGTPVYCAPIANTTSTVTVTATNGVGSLAYAILSPASSTGNVSGAASGVFTTLAPGTYLFEVTDSNGCKDQKSYTVDPVTNITIAGQLVRNVVCNGESNGAVKFTVANYGTSYTAALTAGVGTLVQTGNTVDVTGLVPGTYTVTVTDDTTGCTAFTSVTITQPTALVLNPVTNINANCNFGAKVSVAAAGGTPNYKYQFVEDGVTPNPLDYDTMANAVLDPTVNTQWDAYVIDANGCETKLDITIDTDPLPAIDLTASVYCYTGGPVPITISGSGVAPLMYSIGNGYQSSPNFVLNAPGNYKFYVKDANGCIVEAPYTLNQELLLQATLTQDLTCAGSATITFLATQGTNSYTGGYEVDYNGGGYNPVTSPYTATAAGTYTFRVTDSQGCQAVSVPVVVTPTTTPTATFTQTNVSCIGGSDGSIIVTAADGILPYRYRINGGTFQSSNIFTDLAAGTYNIEVQDAKQCTSIIVTATITQPTALAATGTLTQSLTCGTGNATQPAIVTINVTAGTGTAPYQYSFNGGTNYSGTNTFTTYNSGTVTAYVKDANNCIIAVPVDVIVPALNPPTDMDITGTPVYCSPVARTTSTVTINSVTNGIGTLQYEILSPVAVAKQNSNVFVGLAPDTYLFQVTDANGCTYKESYTVLPVTNITIAGQLVSNVVCNGESNGAVKFTVANYGTSYTASLTAGTGTLVQTGNTVDVTGLVPGTYTVRVVDNTTGCLATASVTVTQPTALVLNPVTNINANCNFGAKVSVAAAGGTPVYKYQFVEDGVTPNPLDYDTVANAVLDPNTNTEWDAYVIDANGCVAKLDITIDTDPLPTINSSAGLYCYAGSPVPITITGTGVTPFTYSIGNGYQSSPNFVLNAPGNYKFYIKDANGCIVESPYTLRQELLLQATLTQDLTCAGSATITLLATQGTLTYAGFEVDYNGGGYFPATSPYTATAAGTYTFRVTDSQGCQAVSIPVIVTPTTTPSATFTQTNVSCIGGNNGSIIVTAANGILPYQYRINGGTYQSSNIFTGLTAGTYNIEVRDAKQCTSVIVTATITQPLALAATAVLTQSLTCGTGNATQPAIVTVNVTAGTGTAPYQYSFNGGANYSATNTFTTYNSGTVTAYIKDANNCIIAAPVDVVIPALNPPTISTINGTDIYCAPTANTTSTVTVNVTNGVGPLHFEILSPASATTNTSGATSGVFTLLDAGTYLFQVTDANGCKDQEYYTVKPLVNITIAGQLVNDVSCNGGANGSVKFDVNNFGTTYTAALIGGPTTGTITQVGKVVTLTNLPIGNYTIEVTDQVTNCKASASVTVGQPSVLTLTETVNVHANCNSGAKVSVTAAGGTPNYRYAFIAGTGTPTAADYSNNNNAVLDPAVNTAWRAYVIDSNNCETFIPITIVMDPLPSAITANVTSQCPTAAGEYTFTVSVGSGVAPYEYSIGSGFQSSPTFTVNKAGTYDITVRDANACTATATAAVTISPALQLNTVVNALPSCTLNNGRITATASGGSATANYRYTLDGGVIVNTTPAVFNNVAPGTHIVRVRDVVTGCAFQVTVEIAPATVITGFALQGTNVSCKGGSDASITATLDPSSAGVNDNPVYTYTLTGTTALGVAVNRPAQTLNVFENLQAGDYTVTVTSGRGCQDSEDIRIIENPVITVAAPIIAQYGCATGTNTSAYATITVATVTGGSGNYVTYEFLKNGVVVQKGAENVYTEADFLGGSYTVNVYDDNGCMGTTAATSVITPFISLDAVNVNVDTAVTCTSNEDITVTVTSTGGTPVLLNYTVTGTNGNTFSQTNTSGVFTGLTIGEYLITVNNPATGCSIQSVHYVNNPNTFDIKAVTVNGQICYGAANGSVDLTFVDNQLNPTNDAGAFNYVITGPVPSNGTTTNAGPLRISNLTAGQYTVTATLVNNPFCTVSTLFTIEQPAVELELTTTKSDITCAAGNNDGEISASAAGGWDNKYEYQLVLNGTILVDYSQQSVFPGLSAGTYTINVRDNVGCIDTATEVLVVPAPIVINATASATMLTCYGDKSAVITVDPPTGGQGSNYMYTLNIESANPVISSGPQTSPIFTGLGAGTYSITVTDGFSCSATSTNIVISEPTEVVPSLVEATSQTCLTQATLTLSAVGGTAPYTYSTDANFATTIGSFASSVTFPVAVGKYSYYVKDAAGCVGIVSNEIAIDALEPLDIDVDVTNAVVKCTGEATGVIVAEAKGGLGNYVYTLENTAGVIVQGPQASGTFDNLVIGDYVVKVVSGDCNDASATITINEPPVALQASFDATNVSCFGENNGKIVITATGGTGVIKYAISPDLNQFDSKSTYDRLSPGTYIVIAQDENGCYVRADIEITQPNPVIITEVPNSMIPEVCDGDKDGAFSIEVKGGTLPYSVSLDNENGPFTVGGATQTTFDFTNLAGGTHTVYVKDAEGCTVQFVENMPSAVILNPTAEVTYDCVNNAQANMVVVTIDDSITNPADVDYSLDNNGTFQPSNVFTNVAPGSHFIVARHTNGCEVPTAIFDVNAVDPVSLIDVTNQSKDINMIVVKASGGVAPYEYSFNGEPFSSSNSYRIYKTGIYKVIVRDKNGCEATIDVNGTFYDFCLPNFFTPNGDGQNDTVGPDCGALAYKELTFDIYDRYGRVVAKYHVGEKWDGRYHGDELPTGDYWYVLKLNDPKDPREFVGHFTLYR
ncbi:T9SS type B sorting domain-containing protein [Flavobacterium ginsenosidimutans]|uniref:T9SS type B sorting domain-containing protein n=1 Tax=Flavobacterium ginsenosidimutans TaxID=687844 RepID=UPI003D99CF21